MFGLHFIQEGLITKEEGRFFSDLYDRRQTGDYDDYVSYNEETVMQLYNQSEGFIKRIIELINK